jgi:Arc/MetJ family transcription regulator
VTKKLIDVDEDLLARARTLLGAATMKETVNASLAEVVRMSERRAHVLRLVEMEGLDLDDDTVMADAWR